MNRQSSVTLDRDVRMRRDGRRGDFVRIATEGDGLRFQCRPGIGQALRTHEGPGAWVRTTVGFVSAAAVMVVVVLVVLVGILVPAVAAVSVVAGARVYQNAGHTKGWQAPERPG
ncbi:MAG: hypothetical protein IIB61_05845 [Planctomycetes bacterium]|nr:hypothetical protein [Planctomycetota bacterium]